MTKAKVLTNDRMYITMIIVAVTIFLFTIVFGQATLTKINIEVENTRKEVALQEQKNEVLAMKRNELLSYDKIDAVAKEVGLAYNNSNIKTVE